MNTITDDLIIGDILLKDGQMECNQIDCNEIECKQITAEQPINATINTGNPDEPNKFSFNIGLNSTESIANSLYKLDKITSILIPANLKPKTINLINLSLHIPFYSAIQSISPYNIINKVCSTLIDTGTLETEEFYPFRDGTIVATESKKDLITSNIISSNIIGTAILNESESPIGIYDRLEITNKIVNDYYETLKIKLLNSSLPFIPSNIIQYNYNINHNVLENNLDFCIDNPNQMLLNITDIVISDQSIAPIFSSGVPSISINDIINIIFRPIGTISKFYNINGIAQISGLSIDQIFIHPPINERIEGSNPLLNVNIEINNNQTYEEQLTINLTAINSENIEFTRSISTNIRIDTKSMNESSNRYQSGIGLYPISFGQQYDSQQSLLNNEELQYINGLYQYPNLVDYSNLIPINGPNYTTIIDDIRWVTFKFNIINRFNISLTINNTNVDSIIIPNMMINVLVLNKTGWLNANKAYNPFINPIYDDDPCLLYHNSTNIIKKLTFGNIIRSGELYVRIGIKKNNNYYFGSINVS